MGWVGDLELLKRDERKAAELGGVEALRVDCGRHRLEPFDVAQERQRQPRQLTGPDDDYPRQAALRAAKLFMRSRAAGPAQKSRSSTVTACSKGGWGCEYSG